MLHAVVMAGGKGTRFWPASRQARPKPFLTVQGTKTLLQLTLDRCRPLIPDERLWVVAAAANCDLVREQAAELPSGNCLGEPEGRNTAPCLAVAATLILRRDPHAVLVALPADHLIPDEEKFRGLLAAAAEYARTRPEFVTLGLRPRSPHTGYGYIRLGAVLEPGPPPIHRVGQFVEKPGLETARAYVASGDYYWNGGIFVVAARTYLAMVERHLPELHALLADLDPSALGSVYARFPSVSIDYGILEKEEHVACLPADLAWSDIGSWAALYEILAAAPGANVSLGPAVTRDSAGNLFHVPGKTVAAIGVNDLVAVETDDVLLLCPRAEAERVRELVEHLTTAGKLELL